MLMAQKRKAMSGCETAHGLVPAASQPKDVPPPRAKRNGALFAEHTRL